MPLTSGHLPLKCTYPHADTYTYNLKNNLKKKKEIITAYIPALSLPREGVRGGRTPKETYLSVPTCLWGTVFQETVVSL